MSAGKLRQASATLQELAGLVLAVIGIGCWGVAAAMLLQPVLNP